MEKGEGWVKFCPSSPWNCRIFLSAEPFLVERRRDKPDLPSYLLERGVSWGKSSPSYDSLRARSISTHPAPAQSRLQSLGQSSKAN